MNVPSPTAASSDTLHPAAAQLADFVLGRLDDDTSAEVERHLAGCADCRQHLLTPADDPLVALLRAGALPLDGAVPAAPSRGSSSGRPLHDYEVLEQLGAGGMGVVWKARQKSLPRLVALKRLRAAGSLRDEMLRRFRREAEAIARLQHSHIVQVYEVGEQDGEPYLALEYVASGTLAGKLMAGPLPARAAAELVETLARAIQHAHRQGILHRDLKPGNVLIAEDGTPKVTDFGLAKLLQAEETTDTQSGAILGTPSYMAPEQAGGRETVGPATDVYALGAVLYECLTGRPPFRGPTTLDTLAQLRERDPVPPRALQPAVPRDLQTICLKCLHKEPGRRYASAAELADDLCRFLRGEPIHARPVGRPERLLKWLRRKPYQAAALGLIVLTTVGTVGGVVWHNHRLRQEVTRAEGAEAQTRQEYRAARALSNQILNRLHDLERTGLPGERKVLAGILDDTLAFYKGSPDNGAGSDPEVRLDTARTLHQIGDLQAYLGRGREAAESFRAAAELCEQLVAEGPKSPEPARELRSCYSNLGVVAPDPDRLRYAEKALQLDAEAYRRQPDSLDHAADLANSHLNLGSWLQTQGRGSEAEGHYEQAIALARRVLAGRPKESPSPTTLVQCYCNLGLLLAGTDPADRQYAAHLRRAGDLFREAEALLEPRTRTFPRDTELHRTLAAIRLNWGNLLGKTGRYDEALATYGRGIAAIEELLRREPGYREGRTQALSLHGARAQFYEGRGRFAESVADWDRVVELAEGPQRLIYRLQRANTLRVTGDLKHAVAEADAVAAGPGSTPEVRYTIACVYSLCREPDKAMRLLNALHKEGYFDKAEHLETLRTDTDLDPLRRREDFRRLLGGKK